MTELDNAKHVIISYITFVLIPAMCKALGEFIA